MYILTGMSIFVFLYLFVFSTVFDQAGNPFLRRGLSAEKTQFEIEGDIKKDLTLDVLQHFADTLLLHSRGIANGDIELQKRAYRQYRDFEHVTTISGEKIDLLLTSVVAQSNFRRLQDALPSGLAAQLDLQIDKERDRRTNMQNEITDTFLE